MGRNWSEKRKLIYSKLFATNTFFCQTHNTITKISIPRFHIFNSTRILILECSLWLVNLMDCALKFNIAQLSGSRTSYATVCAQYTYVLGNFSFPQVWLKCDLILVTKFTTLGFLHWSTDLTEKQSLYVKNVATHYNFRNFYWFLFLTKGPITF